MIILKRKSRGGWTPFDLILSGFCECHGVYTTKKTVDNDASSAGATTTAGCQCIGSFETEKPKVFCIVDIVLVLVYH